MFNDVFNDKFISSRVHLGETVEYWTDTRFSEDKEECKMEDKCVFCGGDMTLERGKNVIFTRKAMDQIYMTGGDEEVIRSMFDISFESIRNRFGHKYFGYIDSSMFSIRYKLLYGSLKIVPNDRMRDVFDRYHIGWYNTGVGDIIILSDMDKLMDILDAYIELNGRLYMNPDGIIKLDFEPFTGNYPWNPDYKPIFADNEPVAYTWTTKKSPLKFKLYFGTERTTGKRKTICVWEDGIRTIIQTGDMIHNGAPVALAFAWCYVKRTFGTVSKFKKHVDKRTYYMDGVLYFEGDCTVDDHAQANLHDNIISMDIYDAAALAITAKRYGGLKKLNEDIADACDVDADLREMKSGEFTAMMTKPDEPFLAQKASEVIDGVGKAFKELVDDVANSITPVIDDGYLGKVGGTNEKKDSE